MYKCVGDGEPDGNGERRGMPRKQERIVGKHLEEGVREITFFCTYFMRYDAHDPRKTRYQYSLHVYGGASMSVRVPRRVLDLITTRVRVVCSPKNSWHSGHLPDV